MNKELIGIDSQCLSYLIDAMQGIEEPSDALAPEKISLFRIYLYTPGTLYVTPTVIEECAAIRDIARKKLHDSYIAVLFEESPLLQSDNINSRVKELELVHSGINDCRILAEAEDSKFTILLTYDNNFLTRLREASSIVRVCRPTEYWGQLNINHDAKPDKEPNINNPLANQTWWKW